MVSSLERVAGRITAPRGERILGWATLVAMAASAVMSLVVSPPDAQQGNAARLLYIHVPSAWLAYLSFAVVFVASIAYLATRRTRWDRLAAASAEVGVLFTALAIALGALWGKPVWGTWWTWDPRITTTTILLLIYVGYLAVRRLSDSPARRARWAAVVGVVGFLDVPVSYLSVTWWRGLHQGTTIRLLGESTIAPIMQVALMTGVFAFTLLFLYLVTVRLRLGRLEDRAVAEALSPRLGQSAEALLEQEASARG